jgi:hypothetical protein
VRSRGELIASATDGRPRVCLASVSPSALRAPSR